MRLFLIYYICSKEITETEVDQYANILQVCHFLNIYIAKNFVKSSKKTLLKWHFFSNFNSMYVSTFFIWQEMGCDLAPLNYLKRWKSLTQMTTMPATDYSGGETRTVSMFSKLMQQSSSLVMEGVKNLVVKKHNLPGKSTDQNFF